METFLFIVVIVVVIILFNKISGKQDEVLRNITDLRREISELKKPEREKIPPIKTKEEVSVPKLTELDKTVPKPRPILQEEEFIRISKPKEAEPVVAVVAEKPARHATASAAIPTPLKPTFWEKNPDLEKFIGENLINKIGIAILVLGIGFFVKYAIDKEWINEYGRVGIGILAGGLLIGIAHKLRKSFAPFSSVLIGGGMAVMYFTITIAFHDYQIFSQTAAFVLMVLVTAFTIFLSYVYDRVELAVLAIIGGFTAPFLVSTGEGNYVVLFTYLIILNVGMLVLAYFKKWNIVNIVSYLFTVILFSSWLGTKVVGVKDAPFGGALFLCATHTLII